MRAPRRLTASERLACGAGNHQWLEPDREWKIQEYAVLGKSLREIRQEVGCGKGTLKKWILSEGIPLRSAWTSTPPVKEMICLYTSEGVSCREVVQRKRPVFR